MARVRVRIRDSIHGLLGLRPAPQVGFIAFCLVIVGFGFGLTFGWDKRTSELRVETSDQQPHIQDQQPLQLENEHQ